MLVLKKLKKINKKPTKKTKNRADFLVYKTDIEQAINDGWSVRVIWETLIDEKKVTCSYPAFNNYVNKLIVKKQQKKEEKREEKKSQKIDGFNFNSIPNKDELI